jgi:2-oxoglutarate dehydrogenase complex dehydrogenase (E1) component-like enzyme
VRALAYVGILHLEKRGGVRPEGDAVTTEAVLDHLRATYSGRIAFEYMYLPVRTRHTWSRREAGEGY